MFRSILLSFMLPWIFLSSLFAQPYSQQDSTRASSYFKQSFQYRLYSEQHQKYLDSALHIIPTHAYYWQQKSMPYYKEDQYEIGRPFLDSAVKYNPRQYLEYRGFMRCIFEKNYTLAKEDFHEAKARYGLGYTMDHSYDFFLGLCSLQLNQLDSAAYYFDQVIQDDMHHFGEKGVHFNHWFYKAMVAYAKEEMADCILYLDKVLTIYPQMADAHYYKALCLLDQKKTEEAKQEAHTAKQYAEQHYSINEDNAIYEWYPYQVKTYYYDVLENGF